MASTLAILALAPHDSRAQGAPKFSDCGGKLMQQDTGAWFFWGRTSSPYGGLAGLTPPVYQQGLSNGGLAHMRRLKSLESLFSSPSDPARKATRIDCSAGGGTAHAVLTDGSLVGWGSNDSGQLGNGDTTKKVVPTPVPVAGVVSIKGGGGVLTGGNGFTLALRADGTVAAWGANEFGQVADGTIATPRPNPASVPGLTNVADIAVGRAHAIALLRDGTVRSWGFNASGQLGDGSTVNRQSPVAVAGLTNVTAIAAGDLHSVALKSDGSVWAWGSNLWGDLGNGPGQAQSTPVRVGTLENVSAIATNGFRTTFALASNGTVWAWGSNEATNTLLGESRLSCTYECTPSPVGGLPSGVDQIFAFGFSAMARTRDGKLVGWGRGYYGELSLGRLNTTIAPFDLSTPQVVHQGVAASDFDLDQNSDILFRNVSTGDVWLWSMSGAALVNSAGIANVSLGWKIAGIGDADGDGKDDIFWRNSATGANAVWLMNNRQIKDMVALDNEPDLNWKIVAVADLDADGRADLIWRNEADAQYSVWLIGQGGVLQTRTYGGVPSNWEVRGAGDFDGDGKADIIWRERSAGSIAIYRMDGATFNGVNFLVGDLNEWDIVAITDLGRDGYADIVLRDHTGALLASLKLNTSGTAVHSSTFMSAPGGDWRVVSVGDYDGDTHPDLLWRNSGGELAIWRLVNLALPGANLQEQLQNVRFLGNPGAAWEVIAR